LPPQYYSPDWKDIERIEFHPVNDGSDFRGYGKLSLRIREQGSLHTQEIGTVQVSSWEAAKKFLLENGVHVSIDEGELSPVSKTPS
jgi:hypothetical protein